MFGLYNIGHVNLSFQYPKIQFSAVFVSGGCNHHIVVSLDLAQNTNQLIDRIYSNYRSEVDRGYAISREISEPNIDNESM